MSAALVPSFFSPFTAEKIAGRQTRGGAKLLACFLLPLGRGGPAGLCRGSPSPPQARRTEDDPLDAITLSVIQAALQQVCDEMDLTFSRAAFSPVIAEANDRSDGIYSAGRRLADRAGRRRAAGVRRRHAILDENAD